MTIDEKEIMRNRIKERARLDFAKFGYSKVKTDTLATELGISKRTLYENFNSKEELLKDIIDSELNDIDYKVNEILNSKDEANPDFIKTLKQFLALMSNQSRTFTKEFYEDLRRFAPEQFKKIEDFKIYKFKTNFELLYKLGKNTGFVKSDLNKDLVFLLFSHAFQNLLSAEVTSDLPCTSKEAADSIIDILLTGTLTDDGRNRFLN